MSHATHRIPAKPTPLYRPPLSREQAQRGWAQRSNSPVAAALVLNAALAASKSDAAGARFDSLAAENGSERFDSAVRLYLDCRWDTAFESLAALADQGHARAAKLALLMLRYGSTLYGTPFAAKPVQVARWAQRVLRASSRATASPSSITAIA